MFRYDPRQCSVPPGRALEDTDRTKRPRTVTPRRFGRHLRALRVQRGFTQDRLAERSDLSADAIRRLEAGMFSPSLQTLVKLTRGLDLSLTTFFSGLERNRDFASEVLDFLRARTPKERDLAWRVLRSLFDDG
jgi:transcriptional regulator with XRE-family HTH domain